MRITNPRIRSCAILKRFWQAVQGELADICIYHLNPTPRPPPLNLLNAT